MASRTVNDLPYPVSVARRDFAAEALPNGGGVETFDTPAAVRINQARLDHLRSLGLPLRGRSVLDVGCGVGHLAQFFVREGCRVVCVDGREPNVASLRQRYPGLTAHVRDVERQPLAELGRFDVVFCYGLLYHLENPIGGLRNLASACGGLLLLETMVCDHELPLVRIDDETKTFSQALAGIGSRPTPAFVVQALNRCGFAHVYAPRTPPDHEDFRFAWRNDLAIARDGHPLRCVFVAARERQSSPGLVSLL